MKSILTAALLLFSAGAVQAQNSIEQVLQHIETNNKELQANAQLLTSQKLETKTDNNLSNPRVSYAHLWSADDKSRTVGELMVSQSFDFPSLYITRNQLNRLKAHTFDSRAALFRQEKLLQAKELCLDIIMLRQQKSILEERLHNAQELAAMYAKRLETGDANALETNKINLELLNVKTEASLNETTLRNKLQELQVLNGNVPVIFEENQYPSQPFPADYQALKSEVIASSRTLEALNHEERTARKEITLNKSKWLPSLELGYKRNTESGAPLNGMVVGVSFPLFENRHKVKIAKAQALQIELQKSNALLQVESEFNRLYEEAKTLHASMEEYRHTFQSQQDLTLLKQALTGGEISMIAYFVEVAVIYQSHLNYLQLENQYQKVLAKIYKNHL
ncbi:outer membrane efflux protein [gut metagenome]|uniref:Outer membrane efflux protein n=1 Tax=gut metagenome TaxID=749906 RepID=J9FU80_9ZZZZ